MNNNILDRCFEDYKLKPLLVSCQRLGMLQSRKAQALLGVKLADLVNKIKQRWVSVPYERQQEINKQWTRLLNEWHVKVEPSLVPFPDESLKTESSVIYSPIASLVTKNRNCLKGVVDLLSIADFVHLCKASKVFNRVLHSKDYMPRLEKEIFIKKLNPVKFLSFLKTFGESHEKLSINFGPSPSKKHWQEISVLLPSLTALKHLDLKKCKLTDENLKHVSSFKNLQHLDLSDCMITNKGFEYLSSLTNLNYLNLSDCKIIDESLKHLSPLTNLQSLNLSGCKTTDEGLKYFSSLTNLQYLNLSGCEITDEGLKYFSSFSKMGHLNLYNCKKITGSGLSHLSSSTELKRLSLHNCKYITDEGLKNLSFFSKLEHLNLYNCYRLTDEALKHLPPDLKFLDLQLSYQITDIGVGNLSFLTKLEHLDVADCPLITKVGVRSLATKITQLKVRY